MATLAHRSSQISTRNKALAQMLLGQAPMGAPVGGASKVTPGNVGASPVAMGNSLMAGAMPGNGPWIDAQGNRRMGPPETWAEWQKDPRVQRAADGKLRHPSGGKMVGTA